MPAAALIAAALLAGQAAAPAATAYPSRLPAPGGETIIPNANHQRAYDRYHYAPARRVGDTLYVSGVIIFRGQNEGTDEAAFKLQTERAFRQLDEVLKASGATFNDVVMINSFHVFDGPNSTLTRIQQFDAINAVKSAYLTGPHPAWTAVGTSGLMAESGIVEIQLIAHVPQGRR